MNESPESVAERERTAHDKLTKSFKNRLILFGTGKLGRRTLKGLREVGIEPLGFCDNNSVIWGSDIEGLKVFSPKNAVSEFGAIAAFVVTIWNDWRQTSEQAPELPGTRRSSEDIISESFSTGT